MVSAPCVVRGRSFFAGFSFDPRNVPEIPAADHNQPCRAGSSPVYRRDGLVPGQVIEGPAIVEQIDTTVIVFPGDRMTADAWGNLVITLGGE